MRIFIAGCARSGTTLMREAMRCFGDTYVKNREAPPRVFSELQTEKRNTVVKRTSRCWEHLHELSGDIRLLYMIRHPYDVLTSLHSDTRKNTPYYVSLDRWKAEFGALVRLRKEQPAREIQYVRYEELVTKPNTVQQRIQQVNGLTPDKLFTEKPGGIRTSSLNKWENDPARAQFLRSLPDDTDLRTFCREFGYSLSL